MEENPKDYIQQMVMDGRIHEIFTILDDLVKEKKLDNQKLTEEIMMLSGRFSSLQSEQIGGTIEDEQATIKLNKITKSVLIVFDNIPDDILEIVIRRPDGTDLKPDPEPKPEPDPTPDATPDKSGETKFLRYLLLGAMTILMILAIVLIIIWIITKDIIYGGIGGACFAGSLIFVIIYVFLLKSLSS